MKSAPTPLSGTVPVPRALLIATDPFCGPAEAGVKLTVIAQDALGASEGGQLLVSAKLPLVETPAIASDIELVLLNVIVWPVELVPTS